MVPWRNPTVMAMTLLVCLAGPTTAAIAVAANTAGGVPQPAIPPGQGEQCVEDTGFMRREHMHMLKHRRDETVLRGIRVKQYSLKECLDCHAVSGPDATAVSYSDPRHFCRSCHDYAAVSIDCFQCHAARPEHDTTAAVGNGAGEGGGGR